MLRIINITFIYVQYVAVLNNDLLLNKSLLQMIYYLNKIK